jgi:hypothetical protein
MDGPTIRGGFLLGGSVRVRLKMGMGLAGFTGLECRSSEITPSIL